MVREYLRLGVAYILDWIVVIILAVAGGVLNYVTGFHRPFSLADPDLIYPNKKDIISVPVLVIVALAAPAVIIAVLSFTPHSSRSSESMNQINVGRKSRWNQYLWEAHAGILGLCFTLAATLFITSGLKDMIGKPRPNLLARCQPNLDAIATYMVGGLGNSLNSEAEVLVSDGICQQTNQRLLDDAFAAFPSGHSSFGTAGMVYLSLWLCMRFSVVIPYLSHERSLKSHKDIRMAKAAPPLWQVAMVLVPVVTALFICSSRYADFHHAGFDIIAGGFLGLVVAWATFRLYHPPMRRSMGLKAWQSRNNSNAFFARSTNQIITYTDQERDQASSSADERRDIGMELTGLQSRPVRTENSDDPILPTSRHEAV